MAGCAIHGSQRPVVFAVSLDVRGVSGRSNVQVQYPSIVCILTALFHGMLKSSPNKSGSLSYVTVDVAPESGSSDFASFSENECKLTALLVNVLRWKIISGLGLDRAASVRRR